MSSKRLRFSQEQLEINEKCRDSIQTRIVQNQASFSSLKEEINKAFMETFLNIFLVRFYSILGVSSGGKLGETPGKSKGNPAKNTGKH